VLTSGPVLSPTADALQCNHNKFTLPGEITDFNLVRLLSNLLLQLLGLAELPTACHNLKSLLAADVMEESGVALPTLLAVDAEPTLMQGEHDSLAHRLDFLCSCCSQRAAKGLLATDVKLALLLFKASPSLF